MSFEKIEWLPVAKKLLGMRDRFTREAILTDFRHHHRLDAVNLQNGLWATPVASNRYAVVWREHPQDPEAVTILAIVAAQIKKVEDAATLKQKLRQAAVVESKEPLAAF